MTRSPFFMLLALTATLVACMGGGLPIQLVAAQGQEEDANGSAVRIGNAQLRDTVNAALFRLQHQAGAPLTALRKHYFGDRFGAAHGIPSDFSRDRTEIGDYLDRDDIEGVLKRVLDRGLLFMGSSEQPPFTSFIAPGSEQTPVGFNTELAALIAAEISDEFRLIHPIRVIWSPIRKTTSSFIDNVQFDLGIGGRNEFPAIDIAASGLTVTPERAKVGLFSFPTVEQAAVILEGPRALSRGITNLNHADVVIGVSNGTTWVDLAKEEFPRATIRLFNPQLDTLMQQVKDGLIDAAVGDEIVLENWAKTHNLTQFRIDASIRLGGVQSIAWYYRQDAPKSTTNTSGGVTPPSSSSSSSSSPSPLPPPGTTTLTMYTCTVLSSSQGKSVGQCRQQCGSLPRFNSFGRRSCQFCAGPACAFLMGAKREGSCCASEQHCCHRTCSSDKWGFKRCNCANFGLQQMCSSMCPKLYHPSIRMRVAPRSASATTVAEKEQSLFHFCHEDGACAGAFIASAPVGKVLPCNLLANGEIEIDSDHLTRNVPITLSAAHTLGMGPLFWGSLVLMWACFF